MITSATTLRFAPPGVSAEPDDVFRRALAVPIRTSAFEYSIVHQAPGRVRLRMPLIQSAPSFVDALRELLARRRGIQSTRINARCAAVVITFDQARLSVGEILGWIRRVSAAEASSLHLVGGCAQQERREASVLATSATLATTLRIGRHLLADLRQSITVSDALDVLCSVVRGDLGRSAVATVLLLLTRHVRSKIAGRLRGRGRLSNYPAQQPLVHVMNRLEPRGGRLCAA